MYKLRGFTLIELLVVLAIAAILATLAAPSMVSLIQSNAITGNVNQFLADLRYTRSEAIRRGGNVVMCRSNAPEASSPSCGTGTGPGNNGWVSGWVIFHDLNADGGIDSGEPILRVQSAITNVNSIVQGGSSSSTKFKFTATGRLTSVSSSASFQFGSNPPYPNTTQRVVCLSVGGRARIAGDGYASCGASGE